MDTTERLHSHFSFSCIGEGNGNPLQFLAWRIPGTGEPGGLQSTGSQRVGQDWAISLSLGVYCNLSPLSFFIFAHQTGCVIPLRSMQTVEWLNSLFLFLAEEYSVVWLIIVGLAFHFFVESSYRLLRIELWIFTWMFLNEYVFIPLGQIPSNTIVG